MNNMKNDTFFVLFYVIVTAIERKGGRDKEREGEEGRDSLDI
jgi:hypothetical protein